MFGHIAAGSMHFALRSIILVFGTIPFALCTRLSKNHLVKSQPGESPLRETLSVDFHDLHKTNGQTKPADSISSAATSVGRVSFHLPNNQTKSDEVNFTRVGDAVNNSADVKISHLINKQGNSLERNVNRAVDVGKVIDTVTDVFQAGETETVVVYNWCRSASVTVKAYDQKDSVQWSAATSSHLRPGKSGKLSATKGWAWMHGKEKAGFYIHVDKEGVGYVTKGSGIPVYQGKSYGVKCDGDYYEMSPWRAELENSVGTNGWLVQILLIGTCLAIAAYLLWKYTSFWSCVSSWIISWWTYAKNLCKRNKRHRRR